MAPHRHAQPNGALLMPRNQAEFRVAADPHVTYNARAQAPGAPMALATSTPGIKGRAGLLW